MRRKGCSRQMEWTPKVRQQVKGRNTLNGARYGFVPNCLQSRFEDYSDASLGCGCEAWRSSAEVPTEPENVGTVAQRMAGPRGNGLPWHRATKHGFARGRRSAPRHGAGAEDRPAHHGK